MGSVLAVWGRLSSKLGVPVAFGGRAGRCLQPPTSDTKAGESTKLCREGPVARTEPRPPHRGPRGAPPEGRCTETLFITLPEMDLWEQLLGVLAPSLWQVMASGHCQGDAGTLALSGPQEAALAAKVAISELLILVGRAVPSVGRFFRPCPELSLFLGEGDGAGLRAGAVVRLGGKSDPASGASVVTRRALSQRGAPHAHLEVCSPPGAVGLAAGAVLQTLEAATRLQVTSVAICVDSEGAWLLEAVAEAIDTFAWGRPTPPLSSISVVAADGALVATFHRACAKRWPLGESRQELLGNVLRAQERVCTQVVSGSLASQKTDVLVLPVALETDGLEWCPQEVRALAERALGAAGHSGELQPGKVLTVPGTALPDLHCKALYLVQLDGEALQQQGAPEVMRQMVRSCLCSVYGAFLESVSFPLLGAGQILPAMLEEVSCFLEHHPNTWMKLVQIVHPLGLPAPCPVAEEPSTPAEAVGFCWPEHPLFLRYVDESPAVQQEFKRRLEEAGYGFRACPHWGILSFLAVASPEEPCGWEAAFRSVRQRYMVHHEGREDLLEALAAEPSLVEEFGSIRVYDGEDFVGLAREMAPFLRCLAVRAFQRQLVSREYPAEPLPRWVIVKDVVEKELPAPHVSMELRQGAPAIITFQGPRRQVAEAESRCQQLLRAFRVLSVPVSPLQARFIQEHREDVFTPSFFLDRGIAAVLELPTAVSGTELAWDLHAGLAPSEGVSVAGLEQGKLQHAAELLGGLVGCRTVPIEEGVHWATQGQEWAELLAGLGAQRDVALHCAASRAQLVVVGFQPYVAQAEAAVQEYLQSNSLAEERLDVPRLELAEAGAELLRLMAWEHLQVTLQLHPNTRVLSLRLRGLLRHLRLARRAIKADLDSLVLGTVPIRGRALGEYLCGEGATLLQDLAQQLRCVVSLRGAPPTNGPSSTGGQGAAPQAPEAPRKPLKVPAGAPKGLELRVLGREPDVGRVKAAVAGFVALFHDESICNVELVAVGTQALRELGQASLYQFPVSLRRLPGNVLRVRGAWEDVAKAVAAVHARIQAAQRQRVEAEVLYGLVKWQHLALAGWRPLSVATNQRLETAYASGERRVEIEWDGQRAEIDLLKAVAVVRGTGAPIHLRREICLWDRCLAPHWEPMGESLVRLVELAKGSEEYREVAEGFKRTAPGYCILNIQRVQNRVLWVSYCWQRRWMEEKNPPGELNERLLYHGTRPENRRSIQEIGLRITCRKVGIYGQGLYFAAEAARSADYAKPDAHGHRFMFQVRVLTGQFTQGKEDMVLPPEKPDGGGRYDSVVNVVSRPSIFVTFFDDLTYPEYLITFRGTRPPLN
ncbi:uncharacterized protein LOC123348363 [Mauremys mutica]|uniref:uncharacterized protein LOC123348363 n=1 Tax=Mauremys mutica TaxID=74926 RepID=UPI001D169CF5|nr:uncharacterized protein LOC123348363 [Mauremys mutica]